MRNTVLISSSNILHYNNNNSINISRILFNNTSNIYSCCLCSRLFSILSKQQRNTYKYHKFNRSKQNTLVYNNSNNNKSNTTKSSSQSQQQLFNNLLKQIENEQDIFDSNYDVKSNNSSVISNDLKRARTARKSIKHNNKDKLHSNNTHNTTANKSSNNNNILEQLSIEQLYDDNKNIIDDDDNDDYDNIDIDDDEDDDDLVTQNANNKRNSTDDINYNWRNQYPLSTGLTESQITYDDILPNDNELNVFNNVQYTLYDSDNIPERSINCVILGTPNAGKSLLLNSLVSTTISAVSRKRNTTRSTIIGTLTTHNNTQIVIYDTPGINRLRFNKQYAHELSSEAWSNIPYADCVLLIVDAASQLTSEVIELIQRTKQYIAEQSKHNNIKVICVLNKVDLVKPKTNLLTYADKLLQLYTFDDIFYISALYNDGIDDIISYLIDNAVDRPHEYDTNEVTDMDIYQRCNEIIRTYMFERLHQDIPYSVTQRTTNIQYLGPSQQDIRIDHILTVSDKSHQPIIIGSNGSTIRYIIEKSKTELSTKLFNNKNIHLYIQVQYHKNEK